MKIDKKTIVFILIVILLIILVWFCLKIRPTCDNKSDINKKTTLITPSADNPITTVYVNEESGNDTNSGLLESRSVRTFDRALKVLSKYGGALGVVKIGGSVPINLGDNPVVSFGSVVRRYDAIKVEGVRSDIFNDTVTSISIQNPQSVKWYQVTGNVGGYSSNLYETHFINNNNASRVYVVESNTTNTVNTIAGTADPAASQSTPPVPVETVPWEVGDSFTLFKVGDSSITWTGQLSLDIPLNKVTFAYLSFTPTALESRIRGPDGPQPRMVFEACRMVLQSTSLTLPSLMGSMLLKGVYASSAISGATLTGFQRDRSLHTESMWVDGGTLVYSGSCSALWLKNTNGVGTYAVTIQQAAQFYGSGIEIANCDRRGLLVAFASDSYIKGLKISRTNPLLVSALFSVDTNSQSVFVDIDVESSPTFCNFGVEIQESTMATIQGHVRMHADRLVNIAPHASLDFIGLLSWDIPATITAGHPFTVNESGSLTFIPLFDIPISTIGSNRAIVLVNGGRVDFHRTATNYQWSTAANIPLVDVRSGGVANIDLGLGGTPNFNYGVTPTAILKCGANPVSSWAVSENDFSAVGTQNAKCSR